MAKGIREVMTSNPCTIDAGKPVSYAAKMMRDEDVGLAPIVEGDRLVGTLTDRDIAIRVVAEGRDPESTLVKDVASSDVVTVDPEQDLDEALRLMAEDGRVVGVVAQADVARQADDRKTGEVVERISQ
jgi:CBS domain-containing protein